MNTTDSKFAKSLQIHTLENLVFQKRQRKTISQQPINPLNLNNRPKNTKLKKIRKQSQVEEAPKASKSKAKKQVKVVQTPKKNKIIKKRKYLSSKDLVKSKKPKSTLNNKTKQITKKKINIQQNRNKLNQNQKQQPKVHKQTQKNAGDLNPRKTRQQKAKQPKKQINQKNEKIQSPEIDIKQIKIESTPKKLGRPRKIITVSKQNLDSEKQDNEQNINKDNSKKSPVKSRALANILERGSKKQLIEVQQAPRQRQAKLNALKKCTQKQLYPQDSVQFQKDFSTKRKRIQKVSKTEQYSINRIFRKQPKLDLNPINIQVKLDKFNLNSFKEKFGTFDVIHCSLPLSIIWQLPSISNLMVKGFIFIWVEKGEIALAYHLMKRLGYDVIDQIVWVKCDQSTRTVFNQHLTEDDTNLTQNSLFLNSKSVCFVGYKCPTGQKAQYRTKISNNLIFSCPKFNQPLKKPDQIYEIADLLMPGAKKLQLGGKQQKGWLSLHHNEFRLRKCTVCLCELQQNKGRIFRDEQTSNLLSICQSCFSVIQKQRQQNEAQSESEQSQNQVLNVKSNIAIKNVGYLDRSIVNKCHRCENTNSEQMILCSCQKDCSKLYCKQCYNQEFTSHFTHSIQTLIAKKDIFIPSSHLSCSGCNKSTLFSHFYQCTASGCRTKNHLLCQQCYWKCGYEMIANQNEASELKRKKNDGIHQFKLRRINSVPEEKSLCSCECKRDLVLPHFVCESCVGWRWCGKCKLNDDQMHEVSTQVNQTSDGKHLISLIS